MTHIEALLTRRRWFNDRRFTFSGFDRVEFDMSRVLNDINRQLISENPEVITQFSERLHRLSDALNGRLSNIVNQQRHQSDIINNRRQVDAWTETTPVVDNNESSSAASTSVAAPLNNARPSENDLLPCSASEIQRSILVAKTSSSSDVSVVLNIEASDDGERTDSNISAQQKDDKVATKTSTVTPPNNDAVEYTVGSDSSAASSAAEATSENQATNQGRRNSDWNTLAEISRNADVRRLIKWLCFFLPFFFILILRACFVHTYDFVPLVILLATFLYANSVILRHATVKTNYGLFIILCAVGLLLLEIHYFYSSLYKFDHAQNLLIFTKPNSWYTLIPNDEFPALTALWYVLFTDFVAKFFTIFAKSFIAIAPSIFINMKRKAIYFQWAETFSHLYRWWLPVLPWYTHIVTPAYPVFLQYFLVTLYLVLKLIYSFEKLVAWWQCAVIVLKPTPFGEKPDEIDLSEAGAQCSICFCPFQSPTRLKCKHIFCEDCIATWLNKERTCPICRTQVSNEDKSWRDGSTSLVIYFC